MALHNKTLLNKEIVTILILWFLFMLGNISVHAEDMNKEKFRSLFPKPPAGWDSDAFLIEEISADSRDPSAMVGELFGEKQKHYRGTRTYVQKSNNGQVTVGICTSDCENAMLIPRGDALKDPDVLKQYKESGAQPFNHLSYNGLIGYDDQNWIELIFLDIDLCRIIFISVDTFGDKDVAMKFLKHLNVNNIDEFMKQY